ncbi:ChaN family lipoprotein [Tropicimonas sediminicola]|uniref:Haem-binding uptake, Tiki superfamily, ChaN n=1 Tax=Tropicimonas sediminicola TaxID=1031541 RepID=A0A239KKC2_9RHOB|nr:ChaN family lipoprotein [Tropicimonas sediminicola]SNT18611.1 Haem-binding uptake, Tiki superfamily, ChaN [Tropicimonas sediminicola]
MKLPLIPLCFTLLASQAFAADVGSVKLFDPGGAPVVILGEVHDNPAHHANQAEVVASIQPAALVFEMFTPEQAATANGMTREDGAALAEALAWSETGWPDFSLYHPILLAAPEARIYGAAVAREELMEAMGSSAAEVFGDEAVRYGLGPLPEAEQAEREAMQMEAHCNALPEEMLGGMVEAQRLRDARFSETTLVALEETGGPVAVITGNGHARRDWGMPAYLAAAAPELRVVTLGQFEAPFDAASGEVPHDAWLVTEPAEREDPCAVFRKG